jgi:N-acetylmuramoyl-L-alanine amidase
VTWSNDRGGSGNATGTTSWSVSGVALLTGANVITITARDAAGNTATDTLTVTYTAPLTLSSLTANLTPPQTTGTAITFTATATNGTAPYQYKWWHYDGASWTVLQSWSTSNTFTWTPTTANAASRIAVWIRNAGSTADAYDNAASNASIAFPVTAAATPLSVTSLTANRTAPQQTGTPVTFSAAASGGSSPYQYKWLLSDGTSTTVLQAWSTSSTVTWTPSTANPSYQITVWARSASNTADAAENANSTRTMPFAITSAPTPLTLTSITPNVSAPQQAGTAITFTANVSGGTAPQQYKWWLFAGGTWTVVRGWSTSNTYTWTPSASDGSYRVGVWVRSASSTADTFDNPAANGSLPYPVTPAAPTPAQLALTGLTANLASPQATGSPITFAAAATGGTAPYQYKWLVTSGGTTTVLRAWATGNTYTWTPTATGTYQISVWVRSASNTNDAPENANSSGSFSFTITTPSAGPLTLNGLTSNLSAPQPVGTPVTFTAAASGGTAPYQYKWWLYNGSAWVVLQSWTSSSSLIWTPTAPSGAYRVAVWVRNASSTADAYDNANSNGSIPFPVSAGSPSSGLRLTGLTSSLSAPQSVGTPVTFTATATGGSTPYQFKWLVYDGTTWTVRQNWTTSNSYTWTPTAASAAYRVAVWARNAGSTADTYDNGALLDVPFAIAPAAPSGAILLTAITPNRVSPMPSGTLVTFTATATGGSGAYQYKWWLFDGTSWSMAQDWSSSNAFTWTASSYGGTYRVGLWVRNASSTNDSYDNPAANGSLVFVVQ